MGLHVIATGGTIASLPEPGTGTVRSVVPIEDLLKLVPELSRFGVVSAEEVSRTNGWNITPDLMLATAQRIAAAVSDPAIDGVLVTHGTDTIEETAFLCDLVVGTDKPVVFCGSLRHSGELSFDGPRNLVNAAAYATSTLSSGRGVVLCLNDELHAARWARKLDSVRPSAFGSPDRGPIAIFHDHKPIMLLPKLEVVSIPMPASLNVPVAQVQTYTGMEETLLECILAVTAAQGLVLEGTGAGNIPGSAERGVRAALERRLPVVLATRAISGGTGSHYGGPGGGATLREMGVMGAGGLTASKARLLLMSLLAAREERWEMATVFRDVVQVLAPV
jgi:L-asparaginase